MCLVSGGISASDKTVCEVNGIEFPAVEGDGPVTGCAWSRDCVSRVARDSWNSV